MPSTQPTLGPGMINQLELEAQQKAAARKKKVSFWESSVDAVRDILEIGIYLYSLSVPPASRLRSSSTARCPREDRSSLPGAASRRRPCSPAGLLPSWSSASSSPVFRCCPRMVLSSHGGGHVADRRARQRAHRPPTRPDLARSGVARGCCSSSSSPRRRRASWSAGAARPVAPPTRPDLAPSRRTAPSRRLPAAAPRSWPPPPRTRPPRIRPSPPPGTSPPPDPGSPRRISPPLGPLGLSFRPTPPLPWPPLALPLGSPLLPDRRSSRPMPSMASTVAASQICLRLGLPSRRFIVDPVCSCGRGAASPSAPPACSPHAAGSAFSTRARAAGCLPPLPLLHLWLVAWCLVSVERNCVGASLVVLTHEDIYSRRGAEGSGEWRWFGCACALVLCSQLLL